MKRICFLVVLVFVSMMLISCNSYEDTNGLDNYTLQTITDDNILDGMNCSEMMSSHTYINNKYKDSIKKLNGVKELNSFNKPFKIVLDFEVNNGNTKLVLCTDNEIIHVFDVNKNEQEFVSNLNEKVYLKVAGEDLGFKLEYEIFYLD